MRSTPNRAQTFAAAELLLRQASRAASERQDGQGNLFGASASPTVRHCR